MRLSALPQPSSLRLIGTAFQFFFKDNLCWHEQVG